MSEHTPRLLVVAHGTESVDGAATTARLVGAIAAARPGVRVDLCFLDVVAPRLPDALASLDAPTVVLPLLLSTGYHVQTDIPAAVDGRAGVRVARHLGPHPLLVDVLAARLGVAAGTTGAAGAASVASVALVGAGSRRAEATAELVATGDLLADRLGRPVTVLTMADDLAAAFRSLPPPVAAATYLLAEGRFVTTLRAAADGIATVSEPLGVHPALVELVWTRYDDALD